MRIMLFLLSTAWADVPPPIVGGSTTHSFIQVGAIVAATNNSGYAFCSGTLIDDTWVLTAAHCIEGNDAAEGMVSQGYDIYFVTATNVWSADYDDWHLVSNMIAHPYYSGTETDIRNDIGLLELNDSLSSITPATLNTSTPSTSWGDITYVGFGLTGDNEENSMGVRRTVDVPIWSYLPYDQQIVYTHDPTGQTNICSGDSGGAAFRSTPEGYLLAGVNSFGFDINGGYPQCEGSGAAAGATRVDAYLSWIEQYVDFQSSGGSSGGNSGGSSGGNSGGNSGGSSGGSSGGDTNDQGTGSDFDDEFLLPIDSDFYGDQQAPQKAGCQHLNDSGLNTFWALCSTLILGIRTRRV